MGDNRYGQMLVEGFVRAIPWAIVFSAALVITSGLIMGMVKQEVKEAVEYGAKTVTRNSMNLVLHDPTFNREILPKVKQATKETIEYTATVAAQRLASVSDQKARARQ